MARRAKRWALGASFAGLSVALVTGVVIASSAYLHQNHQNASAAGCAAIGKNHIATMQHGTVTPVHIDGVRCDTLTIVNQDAVVRLVAFGPHDNHVPYDGIAERLLNQGQRFTVTLVQTGSFRFHDHLHDEVQGTFSVTD